MTVHVQPTNDLIEHEHTDDCPCGPRIEPVHRDDGSIGWLVIHNSLDGREDEDMLSGQGSTRLDATHPVDDPGDDHTEP